MNFRCRGILRLFLLSSACARMHTHKHSQTLTYAQTYAHAHSYSLRPKLGNEGLRRVVLSGGALKSKGGYAPQLFADILGVPVCARDGDDEGSAKGAAILAAYMCSVQQKAREDRPERERRESLADFAKKHTRAAGVAQREWLPDAERSAAFDVRYARFAKRVRAIQRSMS